MARWSAAFLIFDGVPSPIGSFLLCYVDPFYRKRPAGFVPLSQKCIRSSSHPDLRESEEDKAAYSTPSIGNSVKAWTRTKEPQETIYFTRQVAAPPGERRSDMQLIHMVLCIFMAAPSAGCRTLIRHGRRAVERRLFFFCLHPADDYGMNCVSIDVNAL